MDDQVIRAIEITGGLSAFTLLAWLIRRTFTHTIPRLADDFKAAMQTSTEFFKEELKASRADFREELSQHREALRELREEFKSEIQYLGQRIDRLSDAVRDRDKEV